jgi:hypothetical protein
MARSLYDARPNKTTCVNGKFNIQAKHQMLNLAWRRRCVLVPRPHVQNRPPINVKTIDNTATRALIDATLHEAISHIFPVTLSILTSSGLIRSGLNSLRHSSVPLSRRLASSNLHLEARIYLPQQSGQSSQRSSHMRYGLSRGNCIDRAYCQSS